MKILSVEALTNLVERHGFDTYMRDLIEALKRDYSRWPEFTKMPRPAMHVPDGVLELMPVCDDTYYTFKYVNCHPKNPLAGQQTVVATGQLSRVDTGYPLMFSEMTVMTALRTAATSALATELMARKDSHVLAIIGTGAQSEFQVRATRLVRDIREVRFFDTDPAAMDKFTRNMSGSGLKLTRCNDAQEAVAGADIITVCTACKQHVDVIKNDWITSGVHINALGGDCPGKTELELSILPRTRLVVEYFEQSFIEGEIQRFDEAEAKEAVYAELHELVTGAKRGRETNDEITLFDSVGIGLEDYSVLRLTYELAEKYQLGEDRNFTPVLDDPKNLMAGVVMTAQKLHFWHKCVECHQTFQPDKFLYTCANCGGLLLVARDEDYVKKTVGTGVAAREHFDGLRFGKSRRDYPNNSGVWLWRDFVLPGFPEEDIVSLNEGQTDLFELPGWLKKDVGIENFYIKLEGQAPSESFKDRGMSVAVSDALRLKRRYPELGISGISCASTGDTSAAAAIYAGYTRDELGCLVLVPFEKISNSQLFQAMAHGADVRAIRHPDGFDGCMKIVQQFTSSHPELVLVNSKNDMRIVGQETIGLEIVQDLSWKVPDWISIPTGNGGNLSALLNGMRRAKEFGLIDKLPGIIVAQTAAADTLVRWNESEYKDYAPGAYRETVASAMNINDPVSFSRIKKLYGDFDIRFYRSSERAILERWAQFTRGGASICPQGAVAVDAIVQAREAGVVKSSDTVVAISTASAIKFSDVGIKFHTEKPAGNHANPYVVVDGSVADLEASL